MSLQYATVITADAEVSLETRIAGALNQILSIYNVDPVTRRQEIEAILAMDYRSLSQRVLKEFKAYTEKINEQSLVDLLMGKEETK